MRRLQETTRHIGTLSTECVAAHIQHTSQMPVVGSLLWLCSLTPYRFAKTGETQALYGKVPSTRMSWRRFPSLQASFACRFC